MKSGVGKASNDVNVVNTTGAPLGRYQRSFSHNHNKRHYEKNSVDPELEAELALEKGNEHGESNGFVTKFGTAAAVLNGGSMVSKPGYKRQVSEVLTKVARALEREVVHDDHGEHDDFVNDNDADKLYSKAVKNGMGGNGKAERKARSRGVSGCSIKKDGGRFEYGLDCMGMEEAFSDSDTDMEAEYDEYSDYVFKYSDKEIHAVLGDYLLNGNKVETLASLEKFKVTHDALRRMTKDLMQLTVETASSGTLELGCNLLEEIIQRKWISSSTLLDGIGEIVGSLEELSIDSPKVVEGMSLLIAKLIGQGLITCEMIRLLSSRLSSSNNDSGTGHDEIENGGGKRKNGAVPQQCYEDALTFATNRTLLNGKLAPSGGHQPLQVLSAQYKLILKEFLSSNDKEAASLRVEELKVPHFNHEFVYQTGLMALERMHDAVMGRLAQLLKYMFESGVLVETCLSKGYERLYASLGDLYLDLPAVHALAKRWANKSLKCEVISAGLAECCPEVERARSRTLSEGPDGKLSVEDDDVEVAKNKEAIRCNGH